MENLSVLVVEDEILIRKYVIAILEKFGCIIAGETSYGEQAVSMTKELSPGLVLMDIRLKGNMDGVEAAKQINLDSSSATPILFMSAYNYQEKVKQEKIPNTVGYINKPVEEYTLQSYINQVKKIPG